LDYWQAISRRKFLLAALALGGLAVGIGVTFLQSPMYRATTSIEIEDAKHDNGGHSDANQDSSESKFD
jgi:uncharacterized protein involved in exopolysaccharide biosynthesis